MVIIERTKKPFFVKEIIEEETTITFIGEYIRDIIATPTKIFNIKEGTTTKESVCLKIPRIGKTQISVREFTINEPTSLIDTISTIKNKITEGKCLIAANDEQAITLFDQLIANLKKEQTRLVNRKNIVARRQNHLL
ncbi:MAG: hypothetical protein WCH65_06000 [bacterium]